MINQQHAEQQSHTDVPLINRMAHSIGFYTARTYLGIQNITHIAHTETHRQDQLKRDQIEPSEQATQPSEQAEEQNQSRTRKAEDMVDDLAQRLGSFTNTVKLNFQRTTARVREDTEDIWAEAQNIRHYRNHTLTQ